jgi:TolB protein
LQYLKFFYRSKNSIAMKYRSIAIVLLMAAFISSTTAQVRGPVAGFFRGFSDIGSPALPGEVSYSEPAQEYLLKGSGENIWFGRDQFSFLWKEMDGDFMLQASARFLGEGTDPHRKTGLMIRSGLSPDAAHVSCVVHGDGLTSLQYRPGPGAETQEVQMEIRGPQVLQLEKKGNTYTISVAHSGELYSSETMEINIEGELLAGLFICSHNESVAEEALFWNVRVFGTAPDDLVPYSEYIGSLLEVMDVESGRRRVLDGDPGSWQAPNWTPDGEALIYNSGGLLYRYELEGRSSQVLPTGFADRNNNDHVISFDGTKLGISHHPPEADGRSVIYTLPLEGGIPERITTGSPSYLHGWSADDRYLVYTAQREGLYNVYRIPASGGAEERLTTSPCLDDGPEYSPDGRYIYFNSCRTGTMQIWRMDPDGSNQTQLTFDNLNNWFPHISPDNRWIVFISFPEDVPADAHPFYQRVYLRIMSVEDMEPRVIGYVYGGQGTINVPSWSPDSRRIAFVSNGVFQ